MSSLRNMENVHQNDETDAIVLRHSESTQANSEPIAQRCGIVAANPDDEYSMNHKKRGIAIIINQENFNCTLKLPTRKGTNKDRDDVRKVLEKLQFQVRVLNDPSKSTLFKELEKNAKEDHTNSDCLVVIVMTHGGPGVLYAKDEAYNIDELWNKFTGDSCKTLHGKPKLFFIQACRGEKLDTMECDTVDARDTSKTKRATYTIPTMANLLVMYSIYDGSWFIQSLCAALNNHGHRKELLRILTVVSRNVVNNYLKFEPDSEKMNALKQMPCIVSMLTKAVYFRQKSISDKPLDGENVSSVDSDDLYNNRELSNTNPTPHNLFLKPLKKTLFKNPPSYTTEGMQQKAYIFHHHSFEVDSFSNGRKSGIEDPDNLKATFENLGFSVHDPIKDLKLCELRAKMDSIASENHEDTGCVLFVIMTCGEKNLLFAKDRAYPITELLDRFSNTKCPTLSGKPKVFLIQACTKGITNPAIDPPIDVLVMYSSYIENTNPSDSEAQLLQTVFIETLLEVLKAYDKKEDINSILDSVRRLVVNQLIEQDPANRETREYPSTILMSMLTKSLKL
ncbi:uncharacterized protein LOC125958020 [Anopheles darlingi]|uniref:uncharacterized protein LOC125958020 n=1 Tax=Anopheles darlingi TaxID=43151 RepID=UPI0021000E25|nr:uncharacterized protein LOC125958020 [Anopheles darlingi]